MRKVLSLLAAPCLATTVLAVSGQIAAHAAFPNGTTGPCPSGEQHILLSTSTLHHSFTGSHDNCVESGGTGNTAFLTDSDFNLVNMFGSNDTIRGFANSSHNSIVFEAGTTGDTITGSNANGNLLEIQGGAVNDVVILLANDTTGFLVVPGSVSDAVLEFSSACTGSHTTPSGDNGLGTLASPIIVC
jgi:hypothetical protein